MKSFKLLLPILLLFFNTVVNADNNKINGKCPGETIEELNAVTQDSSYTELGSIGGGGNDRYNITFNNSGILKIDVTNTDPKRNAPFYFYVSKNNCGNTDSDWNLYGPVKGTSHTFTTEVNAGDTIWIRLQSDKNEVNKGRFAYALALDFKAASNNPVPIGAFSQRLNIILKGNLKSIGNTVLQFNGTVNGRSNAQLQLSYVDIDNDNTTFNSSSATVNNVEASVPITQAKIKWAGLYWQGYLHNDNGDAGIDNIYNFSSNQAAANQQIQNLIQNHAILFQYGNAPAVSIQPQATATDIEYNRANYVAYKYAAFANVTDLLQGQHPNMTYQVANIPTRSGRTGCGNWVQTNNGWQCADNFGNQYDGLGNYGAWSLVIVYENKEEINEKTRNVSIFDGYTVLNANNNPQETITVSGFLTPKIAPYGVDSTLSIFAAEGDRNILGDFAQITNENGQTFNLPDTSGAGSYFASVIEGVPNRNPFLLNNQGIDIHTTQVGTISGGLGAIQTNQTSAQITLGTNQDTYMPSMIAFATELIAPKLCYDYTYGQNGYYQLPKNITPPAIEGDFHQSFPIDVKLFFQNQEEGSGITLEHLYVNIDPINTMQVKYIANSTAITPPRGNFQHIPDQNASESHDNNIPIGTVDAQDFFYVYYSLTPQLDTISTPIFAELHYNLVAQINDVRLDLGEGFINIQNMEPCEHNITYNPPKGIFNVVHNSQHNEGIKPKYYYNLPTQVVERTGNYMIASMNPNDLDAPLRDTTMVALEMLDAEGFHYTAATCLDENATIANKRRIWAMFDNQDFIPLDKNKLKNASFFSKAIENAAFRLSYNVTTDGERLELSKQSNGKYKITNFPETIGSQCHPNFSPPSDNPNTQVDTWCGANGEGPDGNGIEVNQLETCMECIYGYMTKRLCSRDNFAIRPESFRMILSDQDQTNTNNPAKRIAKNDTQVQDTPLISGYNYRLEINATRHIDDNAAPGYYAPFKSNGESGERVLGFKWNSTKGTDVCNDISDTNITLTLRRGQGAYYQLTNREIGKYTLSIVDKLWTHVDWDDQDMQHHDQPFYHPSSIDDCRAGNGVVPESVFSTFNGCTISTSAFVNPDNSALSYSDINTTFYPFGFNLAGLRVGGGPTNNRNVVYINTLDSALFPNGIDENMSYNVQNVFTAVNYNNIPVSNFVDQCFAQDVNMTLRVIFLSDPYDQNATDGNLSYYLVDYNASDPSQTLPGTQKNHQSFGKTFSQGTVESLPLIQSANTFTKDNNGSLYIDLGINFDRNVRRGMNPRYLTIQDLNVSYRTQPPTLYANMRADYKIATVRPIDTNISFQYAYVNPLKNYYDNITDASVQTPVRVSVYCNLGRAECRKRGVLGSVENIFPWWRAVAFDNRNFQDGSIVIFSSPSASLTEPADGIVQISNNGTNENVTISRPDGASLPLTVPVYLQDINASNTIYTDRWLISNPDNLNLSQSPFYRVRFIGTSDWTGYGDTGHVVGDDINSKKTDRVDW